MEEHMTARRCGRCGKGYEAAQADLDFLRRVSPSFASTPFPLPLPRLCPGCRRQRRLAWRNERHLYRRKCAATGKPIVSNIHPDSPFTVYDRGYWLSDAWDAAAYGMPFDFSKSFSENFGALQQAVPRFSLQQPERMENSIYCNFASNCRDCYFLFDSDFCRDAYYCDALKHSEDCCDCSFTAGSRLCYEAVSCADCYNVRHARNCENCSDSVLIDGCIGCRNCALCVNLRNAAYCFENEQLSKTTFEDKLAQLHLESYRGLCRASEAFSAFRALFPRRYCEGGNNENTSGDYVRRCKDVHHCFDIEQGESLRYCDLLYRAANCMDVSSFGEGIEWMYECSTAGLNSSRCAFCFTAISGCSGLYYCDSAYASCECFGCVGIHRRRHCILNRQYDAAEYGRLAARIANHMRETGEWGEYFGMALSPYAYNESVAHEYFPLTAEQAGALGACWRERPAAEAVRAAPLADEAPLPSAPCVTKCTACSCGYRITAPELDLYRRLHLHAPRLCPLCRHSRRMQQRNPRSLHQRSCDGCGARLLSPYPAGYPARIYCEACFQACV